MGVVAVVIVLALVFDAGERLPSRCAESIAYCATPRGDCAAKACPHGTIKVCKNGEFMGCDGADVINEMRRIQEAQYGGPLLIERH